MERIEQKLSYLLLGQNGGLNRKRIIELLRQRPYNLNQLAMILNLNYRTIKHHVDILHENKLITSSSPGGYGDVYFLSRQMEDAMQTYLNIAQKLTEIVASPKFFQNTLDHIRDGVIIVDDEGKIIFWNSAAKVQYGFEGRDMIGEDISFLFGKELLDTLLKTRDTWKPMKFDISKVKHMSSELSHLAISIDIIKDQQGVVNAFSILSIDATRGVQKQSDLSHSADEYVTLLKNLPYMIARFNKEKRLVYFNSPSEDVECYPWKDSIGKPLEDLGLNREQSEVWRKTLDEVDNSGIPEVLEFDMPVSKGTSHFSGKLIPEIDKDGNVSTVLLIAIDVTRERMREERQPDLFDIRDDDPSPIFRVGRDGKIISANLCARDLCKNWMKMNGTEVPVELSEVIEEVLSVGENIGLSMTAGENNYYFMVVPAPDRQYTNIYGYDTTGLKPLQDDLSIHYTELKAQHNELLNFQEELQHTAEKYSDLYDFAPMGYFTLDGKGVILGVNLTGAKMLAWERYYLLGESFFNRVKKGHREKFRSDLKDLFSIKKRIRREIEMIKKDKSTISVRIEGTIKQENNQIQCRLAVVSMDPIDWPPNSGK